MTAILVLLTIIVAVAVDVVRVQLRRRAPVPQPVRPEGMREPTVPHGLFLSPGHTWAHVGSDGTVRVGVDDFLAQVAGEVDGVRLPPPGKPVRAGEPLFWLVVGERELPVPAPMSGEVVSVNQVLEEKPYLLNRDPYGVGWSVSLWTPDLQEALKPLRVGSAALGFLRQELRRFLEFLTLAASPQGSPVLADGGLPVRGVLRLLDEPAWEEFQQAFLLRKEA